MSGPGLLVRLGLALLLLTAAVGTPADADLWGHITFGRDILTSGQIEQPDPYSFTSDRPWVNHEWLAEVSFAEVYRLGGSPGLVVFKVAFTGALLIWLCRYLRRTRASASVVTAMLTLAFVGTYWRMHTVRPQLFSVLFFAILLVTIVHADQGRRRGLLILPPLMALWVNVHGGWIVGIGILGLWTLARVLDLRIPVGRRLTLALAGLGALGATLINPYGIHMWSFLGETVRLGRDDIEEWGSILTYPMALGLTWALTVTAAALALWRSSLPRRPRYDYVAIVAVLAFASFRVSRLDAFFALTVVILLAPELSSVFANLARRFHTPSSTAAKAPALGVIAITIVTVVAMLVPAWRIIGPYATCLTIAGPWVPEADAGRFIRHNQLKGRMLTWFDWGEYAIWHFGPDLQVSMDGRRETVYTDATIQAHRRFYAADETALDYLRSLNPDYIWLPKRLPMTDRLTGAGWTAIFTGPVSVVFARAGAGPFEYPEGAPRTPSTTVRCFPGP